MCTNGKACEEMRTDNQKIFILMSLLSEHYSGSGCGIREKSIAKVCTNQKLPLYLHRV